MLIFSTRVYRRFPFHMCILMTHTVKAPTLCGRR